MAAMWRAWPEERGPRPPKKESARGTRALPGSGPFLAKRQPGADLTVFRAATAFSTPVGHMGVVGGMEAQRDNENRLKIDMFSHFHFLDCVTIYKLG